MTFFLALALLVAGSALYLIHQYRSRELEQHSNDATAEPVDQREETLKAA